MEEVILNLDKKLYDMLVKVSKSYNMDVDQFIENRLEEEYGY